MITRKITYEKSAIGNRLKKFGLALRVSPPSISRANRLFFLCGANRSRGLPSARREAIKRFVEGLSSEYRVIYAEGIFNELAKLSSSKNVLDLEHEISLIADKILIVLESVSAFCELGAFAHKSLREKLIVINNSQFRESNSFINTGPIAAAVEAKSPVLWYPMAESGLDKLDGIGATFHSLKAAINGKSTKGSVHVSSDISILSPNKESLYFIHDLVLFTGPITYQELISILIEAFGKKSYDMLSKLLGILREARLITCSEVGKIRVYQAVGLDPFLRYKANVSALTASFRIFHLKTNPQRFYGA